MSAPDFTQTTLKVLDVYARHVESRPLARDCATRTECCRFRLTGKTPMVTKGEAITAAVGWRAAGRKAIPLGSSVDGACPFLNSAGKCGIYKHRPLGCRTHFCEAAGGAYPRSHVLDAIHELECLDEALAGDGPRPLEPAVRDVWDAVRPAARKKRRKR